MVKKRCVLPLAAGGLCIALLISVAQGRPLTGLTFTADTDNHPTTENVIVPFIKQAIAAFPGELGFTYYPANVLFSEGEAFDALNDGRANFARVRAGAQPGKMHLMEVIDLPGMAPNALVGSQVAQELVERFPEVVEGLPHNAHPYVAWTSAAYQLHSVEPILSMEDIKGKKILVWDEFMAEVVLGLEAYPVQIVSTQSAQALANGLGVAVICPLAAIRSYGIADIAPYHTLMNLGVTSFNLMVHKPIWDDMPEAMRSWLIAHGGMTMARQLGECLERTQEEDIAILQEEGHLFFVISPADRAAGLRALDTFKARWLQECVDYGIDKAVAEEVLAFTQERVAFYDTQ